MVFYLIILCRNFRSSALGRDIPSVGEIECATRSPANTSASSSSAEVLNLSVPPPPVIIDLSHQQADSNSLMKVTQQTKPHQTTTKIGLAQIQAEVDASDLAVLPIRHQFHTTECPVISMSLSNNGIAAMIRGFNTIIGKSQTKEGIPTLLIPHQTPIMIPTLIMLNALENFYSQNFSAAISPSVLRSIQEFNGNDKATTIPWLDQVKLVAERTDNDPVEVDISKLKGLVLGDIITIRRKKV